MLDSTQTPLSLWPSGITAQATRASVKVSTGANRNTARLAPDGMIVSFISSLRPSAIGCSRPNGPTTLGPLRSIMAARTLRSYQVSNAMPTSNGTTIARIQPIRISAGRA